jgi:hypothetical protein
MKTLSLFTIIILCCTVSIAQKTKTITLANESISPGSLSYRVVKVIDSRKDKSNIGWVQTGLANSRRFAVFQQPAEQEVMNLIGRSQPYNDNLKNVILRIEYLGVSEQTLAMSETAKAEVALDLFYTNGDSAWFIARKHTTEESKGMDVTRHHSKNIAIAIEDIVRQFNTYASMLGSTDHSHSAMAIDQVATYQAFNEESEAQTPILLASEYRDGLYVSFEEFRDNLPSISDGYEVALGKNVKVKWVDNEGKKKRLKDNVYALAHQNELYIFFNYQFYPIEKKDSGLFFIGPAVPDMGAAIAGGLLGGAIGGAIAGSASAKRTVYKIDLTNGSLKDIGSMK